MLQEIDRNHFQGLLLQHKSKLVEVAEQGVHRQIGNIKHAAVTAKVFVQLNRFIHAGIAR